MSKKITSNITWVGKVDWELKKFHGQELSTHRGTSYNSYLIHDKKTVLIDTVWEPFAEEYLYNLKNEIDIKKIDFIIANHGEKDHSGALPLLIKEIPDTPIYCTNNGIKSLKGQYHEDWNFVEVKTGDTLDLGTNKLIFVEAKMLHWPDSMFCYLTGENILFSNDAFGQHYATELLFNDLVDKCELYQEAMKYYANILTPFSPLVKRKIDEVIKLNLPVDMICTSHGVIWRENPMQIVEKYIDWSSEYSENQITVIYDTMWEGTKKMADAICKGVQLSEKQYGIKLFNIGKSDKNDIITEVFKSKAVIIGSPTVNRGVISSTAGILDMVKGMSFKNKKAAAFGCYGWSGEGTNIITEQLKESGFEIVGEGLRVKWSPGDEELNECIEYGKSIAEKI